jgi:hypothetical protein
VKRRWHPAEPRLLRTSRITISTPAATDARLAGFDGFRGLLYVLHNTSSLLVLSSLVAPSLAPLASGVRVSWRPARMPAAASWRPSQISSRGWHRRLSPTVVVRHGSGCASSAARAAMEASQEEECAVAYARAASRT